LAPLPTQPRLMVETAIHTGLRWGELIAFKPRHLGLIKRTLTVEETVVKVSINNSPTGAVMLTKPYPRRRVASTQGTESALREEDPDRGDIRSPGRVGVDPAELTWCHAHPGQRCPPAAGCRASLRPGHVVADRGVGIRRRRRPHRRLSYARGGCRDPNLAQPGCLAHDLDVGLVLQDGPQPGADQGPDPQ
jgi:integrase